MPAEEAHNYLFPFTKNSCAGPRVPCAPSRYRTIDGSCNNLFQSSWGQANTAQARLLRPEYEDGRTTPRGGLYVSSLPNPRFISTQLHFDLDREYPGITNLVAAFGQFLDHDITFTPEGGKKSNNKLRSNYYERVMTSIVTIIAVTGPRLYDAV